MDRTDACHDHSTGVLPCPDGRLNSPQRRPLSRDASLSPGGLRAGSGRRTLRRRVRGRNRHRTSRRPGRCQASTVRSDGRRCLSGVRARSPRVRRRDRSCRAGGERRARGDGGPVLRRDRLPRDGRRPPGRRPRALRGGRHEAVLHRARAFDQGGRPPPPAVTRRSRAPGERFATVLARLPVEPDAGATRRTVGLRIRAVGPVPARDTPEENCLTNEQQAGEGGEPHDQKDHDEELSPARLEDGFRWHEPRYTTARFVPVGGGGEPRPCSRPRWRSCRFREAVPEEGNPTPSTGHTRT